MGDFDELQTRVIKTWGADGNAGPEDLTNRRLALETAFSTWQTTMLDYDGSRDLDKAATAILSTARRFKTYLDGGRA